MARSKQQPERFVRSTCPYCGVGCGVEAGVKGGRIVAIRGDKRHPANLGRLCPKPAGLPEAVHHPDRLTHPLRRREDGGFARVSWEEALEEISCRLDDVLRREGPESLGFYISGHLLTEDQYAAIKLARGYLGTPNVASTSGAGTDYEDAFGAAGPPAAYSDITCAECIVLWGSSLAEHHPVTFDRVRRRKKDPDVSVIVVDPRRTPTAELADCFLQIRPGTDLALANAMLRVLLDAGLVDRTFIERYTSGFGAVAEVAAEWTPRRAARMCGIEASDIVGAARRFGEARASLALWTAGVNQGSAGDASNRAIINLCLATGNVGKVGAGPFSLTGQPNAMGNREAGGLAHLLPGHRRADNPDHRAEVENAWGVDPGSIPAKPGLPAMELFRAVDQGRVEVLWVAGANPAVSMPPEARIERGLGNAFVVVQDAYPKEITRLADLILPAAGWGEKAGTMTNSERRVSIVEKLVEPPGEARADWEIFAGAARKMGFGEDFAWADSAEVHDEYVGLTRGTTVDVSGLSHGRLRERPVQWPVPERIDYAGRPFGGIVPMWERSEAEHPDTPRLYADKKFSTPDRRARFEPTPYEVLEHDPGVDFPLILLTGPAGDEDRAESRSSRAERPMRGLEDGPFVELHPEVAGEAKLRDGQAIKVVSAWGGFVARAVVTEAIEPGTAFVPFHWGDLWTENGGVNEATHTATDPVSRQPEMRGAAVRIEPVAETKNVATEPFADWDGS